MAQARLTDCHRHRQLTSVAGTRPPQLLLHHDVVVSLVVALFLIADHHHHHSRVSLSLFARQQRKDSRREAAADWCSITRHSLSHHSASFRDPRDVGMNSNSNFNGASSDPAAAAAAAMMAAFEEEMEARMSHGRGLRLAASPTEEALVRSIESFDARRQLRHVPPPSDQLLLPSARDILTERSLAAQQQQLQQESAARSHGSPASSS